MPQQSRSQKHLPAFWPRLAKRRLPFAHFIGDAGNRRRARRNPPPRIDQLLIFRDDFSVFVANDSDFDDAIAQFRTRSRRFDVKTSDRSRARGLEQ